MRNYRKLSSMLTSNVVQQNCKVIQPVDCTPPGLNPFQSHVPFSYNLVTLAIFLGFVLDYFFYSFATQFSWVMCWITSSITSSDHFLGFVLDHFFYHFVRLFCFSVMFYRIIITIIIIIIIIIIINYYYYEDYYQLLIIVNKVSSLLTSSLSSKSLP